MASEIWKDIPGYEGLYQVSNTGFVKPLKYKNVPMTKGGIDIHGYYRKQLCKDGKKKFFKVHQLVAMAFLGHKPDGQNMVVNHIDNNQLNNRLDNLELVSQRYNTHCHKDDVGVSFATSRNKWIASIYIKPNDIELGRFLNKQDALDMYQKALTNIHLYNGDNNAFRNALKEL